MVDDVTVGSVSGIEAMQRPDGTFYAAVKLSLDENVNLPQNSTATVAQTSLLGSQHIELTPPGRRGAVRPSSRRARTSRWPTTGRYPTTEEVLSSLGVVVNKGNLGALQDITDEAYNAVAGRAGQLRRSDPAARRADRLAGSADRRHHRSRRRPEPVRRNPGSQQGQPGPHPRLVARRAEGAQRQPRQHRRRVRCAAALRQQSRRTSCPKTKDDFAADFKDLYPVIKSLNDNAGLRIKDLEFLPTFPFHYKYLRRAVRGDYLNVFATFDLTLRRLGESVFTTSWGFDPNMAAHERGRQPAGLPDRLAGEPVRPGG